MNILRLSILGSVFFVVNVAWFIVWGLTKLLFMMTMGLAALLPLLR